MSSSTLVDYMILTGICFNKEIINTYPTREAAEEDEQQMFTDLGCVNSYDYLNLHSDSTPYCKSIAPEKFAFFKTLIPEWNTASMLRIVDTHRVITPEDMKYRVRTYGTLWYFINHPERYQRYYPTTGTLTFFPGRSDRLMTQKLYEKKYYVTDIPERDGTPFEYSQMLLQDHYVSGQRIPVLELIETLIPLMNSSESKELTSILDPLTSPQNQWMFRRLKTALAKNFT